MMIFIVLITLYIIIPITLMGYVSGIFLLQSGPMKFSDLQDLLGLFFGTAIFWIYIKQIVSGCLRLVTENLFAISGHYMVSDAILLFCLLLLSVIFQIFTNPWNLRCFPRSIGHFGVSIRNAQEEEEEHNDHFYGTLFYFWRSGLSIYSAEG
jgi:hypothetical protein